MHDSRARGGIAPALLCWLLAACGPGEAPAPRAATPEAPQMAVIRMEQGGEILIRFLSDKAPKHVENFKKLARDGYYHSTTFHRVIPGFMIQGGDHLSKDADPRNDGTGTPGYFVEAEFNDVLHRRGIVAMGRRSGVDTAGSQFYIMVADSPRWRTVLDGKYTVFGEVIRGMEVADRIVTVPRDNRDRPLENQVMKSVTIVPLAEE
jgi:cyclophilin family peptidyl-prolyl cis-trans isomerase